MNNNIIERYNALDGLRVFAMLGILVMHVLANLSYRNEFDNLYRFIVYFSDFTLLFMIISGFSVSCGYYEKIKQGDFKAIEIFYKKRWKKILPFFLTLTIVDVILSPSVGSIFEGIANSTMVFGLIPHQNIEVIGVGWTLGVIFIFYMLYPFFVFFMSDSKRFAIAFAASIFYTFISVKYFGLIKVDFLYCAIYFVLGCGIYLYRGYIKKINRFALLLVLLVIGILFFGGIGSHSILRCLFTTALVLYAVAAADNKSILSSKIMKNLNKYSFEIYLCHMVAYRLIEKLGLLRLFDSKLLSYVFVCLMVFAVSLLAAFSFKKIESYFFKKVGGRIA